MPHSPATGFRDIKPIPEFHPAPAWIFWACLAAAALLKASVLISRRKTRFNRATQLSPEAAALARIAELNRQRAESSISLRDLASGYSLALRGYLEDGLRFPAREQTVHEISQTLPAQISKNLPLLEKETSESLQRRIRSTLRFLERLAFAGESSTNYHLDSQEVINLTQELEQLVSSTEKLLTAERTRISTVGAKSSSDSATNSDSSTISGAKK